MSLIGEPLVSDQWLEKVEYRLRQRFPQIPDTAQFATYVQPPVWHEVKGINREIPATAVFVVRIPSPRDRSSGADAAEYSPAHHDIMLTARAGEVMKVWEHRVRQYKHYVSGDNDPLEGAFTQVLRSLANTHANMRQLLG